MNRKIKIMIFICAVEMLFAADCLSRTGRQKVKAKWDKDSANVKLPMAQEQFEAGQYSQAEESAKQCLNSDPNLYQAKLLLGKIKFAQEDFQQAKRYLQDYISANDRDDSSLFLLALTCERLGDKVSAMEWYKKALEIVPDNTDYIIAVGQMYQAAGDFNSAESLYAAKMASNPSDTDLKVSAAQMYLAQNKNQQALQLYEQAWMLKPENNKLLEALGSCYVLTGQWAKALDVHRQLYSRCVSLEEKSRYMKTMAIAAMNAGDYAAAMKYYSNLAAQDKNNAGLWLSMGQAALGAGSLGQAITCSQKVLELAPDMTEAWLLSGSANYKSGNYLQAAADFRKAADVPKYANFAWLMTGRCYEKLGRNEQSQAAYQEAEKFGSGSELQRLLAKTNGKD